MRKKTNPLSALGKNLLQNLFIWPCLAIILIFVLVPLFIQERREKFKVVGKENLPKKGTP